MLLLLIKAVFVVGLTLMMDKSPAWPQVPWFVTEILIVAIYVSILQILAVIDVNKKGSGLYLIIMLSLARLSGLGGELLPSSQWAIIFLLLALAAQVGQYFVLRCYFNRYDLVAAPAKS